MDIRQNYVYEDDALTQRELFNEAVTEIVYSNFLKFISIEIAKEYCTSNGYVDKDKIEDNYNKILSKIELTELRELIFNTVFLSTHSIPIEKLESNKIEGQVASLFLYDLIEMKDLVYGIKSDLLNQLESNRRKYEELSGVEKINKRIEWITNKVIETDPNICGDFYISVDSIYKYIKFYFWCKFIQDRGRTFSLGEVNRILIENCDLEYLKDNSEESDQNATELERFFERGVDQFNNLNPRTKMEYEKAKQNKRRESNRKLDSKNIMDIRSIPFLESNLTAYRIMREVKESGFQEEVDYFLKSLNSILNKLNINRKNCNLKNINYSKMKEVYDYLLQRVCELNPKEKGLYIYQIEKGLNLSLISEILKQCSKVVEDTKVSEMLDDLVLLFLCPLIEDRKKYAVLYFQLNESKKEAWRNEVSYLNQLICDIYWNVVQDQVIELEIDRLSDQEITFELVNDFYTVEMFNDYCGKFDFKKDHFVLLMEAIQKLNDQINQDNRKYES